jgi:hypothetical protein
MQSLSDIYFKQSSKKAGFADKGTIHSYIDYYEQIFLSHRSSSITFLEIGINRGYSTRMWREYFTNAKIVGVDIVNRGESINNCELIYKDATDPITFEKFNNFDIVIDDGSHKLEDQIKSFEILFPKLNKNGIYCIEDIQDINATKEIFLNLHSTTKIHDFRSNKNRYDDVIVEIRKV